MNSSVGCARKIQIFFGKSSSGKSSQSPTPQYEYRTQTPDGLTYLKGKINITLKKKKRENIGRFSFK